MNLVKSKTSASDSSRSNQDQRTSPGVRVVAESIARTIDGFTVSPRSSASTKLVAPVVYCTTLTMAANKQIGRLWSTESFEKGWDGADAEPPNKAALSAAQDIISRVAVYGVPIPVASVGCDGQSNLYWHESGLNLDVDILNDVVSYCWDDGDEQRFEEEGLIPGGLPPRLMKLLFDKYAKSL